MEKPKHVSEYTAAATRSDSGTPSDPGYRSPIPEHWVDKLFAEFSLMYPHRFATAYPAEDVLQAAKRRWAQSLATIDPAAIRPALEQLEREGGDWPPSLPKFISLCKSQQRVGAHRLALPSKPRQQVPESVRAERVRQLREALGN